MKFYLDSIYWIFQKHIAKLTVYRLLVLTAMLWIIGCWGWIIPVYMEKISTLKNENHNISQATIVQPQANTKNIHKDLMITSQLNYAGLLVISQQHSLKFEEFQYIGKPQSRYQVVVKGTWLHVREFLSELIETYGANSSIESLDFQRDQLTNEVRLTILISIGEVDEIASKSSS
jgi:hypothetical protein